MKRFLPLILISTGLLAVPHLASAQTAQTQSQTTTTTVTEDWSASRMTMFGRPVYGRVEGGWSWLRDLNATSRGGGAVGIAGEIDNGDNSFVVGAGFGFNYIDWLRTELVVNYRGGYELNGTDTAGVSVSSDIVSWATMLNGYVNVPIRLLGLQPYVGAGIGWAFNNADTVSFGRPGVGTTTAPGGNDNDLAWQLMAGVGFAFAPNLVLDVGYRYVDLGNFQTDAAVTPLGTAASGIKGDITAHEALVSLRFSF